MQAEAMGEVKCIAKNTEVPHLPGQHTGFGGISSKGPAEGLMLPKLLLKIDYIQQLWRDYKVYTRTIHQII